MNILREFISRTINEGIAEKLASILYIVNDDGKVLSVSRKDDPSQFGLPGGKVDPGETPYQAAKRELKEETGLDATNLKLVFVATEPNGVKVYTFTANVSGKIATEEVGAIRWVTHEQLVDPSSTPYSGYNVKLFKAVKGC